MKPSFWRELTRQVAEQAGVAPAPAGQAADAATAAPEPAAGPDLSFVPSDFHTDGQPDLSKFSAHYQEIVARDAQAAERAKLIPEGDYAFALPEDLKFDGIDVPENFAAQLSLDDPAMKPLFAELSGVLKEIGAPAAAGTKLMGVLAKYEAHRYAEAVTAMKSDLATLGTPMQQDARIGTVGRALETRLPAEQAAALKAMTTSAKAVQALETLLKPGMGTQAPPPAPPPPQDALRTYYETPTR